MDFYVRYIGPENFHSYNLTNKIAYTSMFDLASETELRPCCIGSEFLGITYRDLGDGPTGTDYVPVPPTYVDGDISVIYSFVTTPWTMSPITTFADELCQAVVNSIDARPSDWAQYYALDANMSFNLMIMNSGGTITIIYSGNDPAYDEIISKVPNV